MSRQCNFCSQLGADYVCPKCGLFYCSLNCYRHPNHLECSELFYKDLVLQELSLTRDNKLKQSTLELLKKMRLDGESQEEDMEVMLNFDGDEVNDKVNQLNTKRSSSILISPVDDYGLSTEERNKFDRLVESGGIFNLLPANFWDPWYIQFSSNLLLKAGSSKSQNNNINSSLNIAHQSRMCNSLMDQSEEGQDEEAESEDEENVPSYPTNLPKLSEISKKEPSPLIKCSLIQAIFAYCSVCRYFVGGHHSHPLEPYDLFINLSSLDSSRIHFPTTNQCLQFASRYLIEQKKMPLCFVEKLFMDTHLIIKQGNRLVLRCLLDALKLCKEAKRKRARTKDDINRIICKLKFYMSWCNEKEIIYQSDAANIQFEALSLREMILQSKEISDHRETNHQPDPKQSDRKLIEIVETKDSQDKVSVQPD